MEKILVNKIRCKSCGDIIESTNVHDFKFCSCGKVAVDGGHEYLRRCFKDSPQDYEDLSEVTEISNEDYEREQEEKRQRIKEQSDRDFLEFLKLYDSMMGDKKN